MNNTQPNAKLAQMITDYERLSAANSYLIGFEQTGKLYVTEMLKLRDDCLKLDKAAESKGGMYKIRVRISAKVKAMLIATKQAACWGDVKLLDYNDKYNKGEHFERAVTEKLTGKSWMKDSVPFYVAGDIEYKGKQVQIKFDGAELTNERTLARAMARA